jgi:hypothetical protein
MSQKSSLTQTPQCVPRALTSDNQVTDAIHAKQASPRSKDVNLLLGLAQKLATDFSAQTV